MASPAEYNALVAYYNGQNDQKNMQIAIQSMQIVSDARGQLGAAELIKKIALTSGITGSQDREICFFRFRNDHHIEAEIYTLVNNGPRDKIAIIKDDNINVELQNSSQKEDAALRAHTYAVTQIPLSCLPIDLQDVVLDSLERGDRIVKEIYDDTSRYSLSENITGLTILDER